MAPELRKRKSLSETKTNSAAKGEKTSVKAKRKAAEDASPLSLKKQKSVKKTATANKAAEKPAQKKKTTTKPTTKPVEEKPVVEDEETIDVGDAASGDEEEDSKQVQALVTELDSDDEDMAEGVELFEEGQDVGKIPKVSNKVQKGASNSMGEPGVIYIGRIPHGFYEHEMRQYFEQFGPINKLRVSRNKKTGASKHYAFVEFAEASTAEIVAKTMDNYLLFGHILKCRVIAKEQVHKDMFKGANRRFKKVPWNKMAGQQLEKALTESDWAVKVSREKTKRAKKAAKLTEIGYDFDAPEIKDVPAPGAIETGEKDDMAIEDAPVEKEAEEEKVEEVVEEEKEPVEEEKPAAKAKAKVAPKAKATKAKVTKAGGGKGRKSKAY